MKNYFIKFKNKIYTKPFIITMIIVLIPTIYTFTRYFLKENADYYLESKNFYFNSNRLKKDNPLYKINNWTGVGVFTLDISMNSRKNNLLESNFDIAYNLSYTCTGDVICSISKNSGVIYETTHMDDFVLTISPTRAFDEGESVYINVSATSTVPYVSTISADFEIVVGKRGVSYTIDDEDNRPYLLVAITNAITSYEVKEAFDSYSIGDEIDVDTYLNLTSTNKNKCISALIRLNFDPNDVVLDTTSSILNDAIIQSILIDGINYVNEITFKMDAMSSLEVRFYKLDNTKNYSYPFNASPIVLLSVI